MCFVISIKAVWKNIFYEFDGPEAFWIVTGYRKEAVFNFCCVCVFVNEYSTLWMNNIKRDLSWLTEFFVLVNTDFIEINSFGRLYDVKLLQNIKPLFIFSDLKKKNGCSFRPRI